MKASAFSYFLTFSFRNFQLFKNKMTLEIKCSIDIVSFKGKEETKLVS